MLSILAAFIVAGCMPDVMPTAEVFRAQHGKPDHYEVRSCGGGQDEYGKKIAPWKCLIWRFDGKGTVLFALDPDVPVVHWHVTGCNAGEPKVTKDDGPTWRLVNCVETPTFKDVRCPQVQLGLDYTRDWAEIPNATDETGKPSPEFANWFVTQSQTCSTYADAQRAVSACLAAVAPEKAVRPTQRPPQGKADPAGTKMLPSASDEWDATPPRGQADQAGTKM